MLPRHISGKTASNSKVPMVLLVLPAAIGLLQTRDDVHLSTWLGATAAVRVSWLWRCRCYTVVHLHVLASWNTWQCCS
jgi:hypothetical protein